MAEDSKPSLLNPEETIAAEAMRHCATTLLAAAQTYADNPPTGKQLHIELKRLVTGLRKAAKERDRQTHDALVQEIVAICCYRLVYPRPPRKTKSE